MAEGTYRYRLTVTDANVIYNEAIITVKGN